MNFRKLNGYIAAAIFVLTLIMYAATTQSSVAFWDAGELAAATIALEVPHPPGTPLFEILGRLAMMVPVGADSGFRINLLSALSSALTIMFMYLIGVKIISRWKGSPTNPLSAILVFSSSAIGALTYSVTDTFWFNAVESEVFAMSMLFVASVVWLALVWFERAEEPGSDRYLLLIAYLMGLSIGVHQLSLLAYFTVALLVYFRYYEFAWRTFLYFLVISMLSFFVIFPVIVEWLPGLLNGNFSAGPVSVTNGSSLRIFVLGLLAASVYGVYRAQKNSRRILGISLTAVLLIILGYSTYTLILIRAGSHPPINENAPDTLPRLVEYLSRSQYGQQPPILKRRWDTNDPAHMQNYRKYSSDWDFFWKYQLNHMFLRYIGFNFIGRAGDIQDAPVAFIKTAEGWFDGSKGYPARYYGIPLFMGLFGLWYHFKRDWKFALAFLTLFVMMGFALVMYFNMFESQPRERDYFFVGAFFGFSIWIGLGVSGIVEYAGEQITSPAKRLYATVGLVILFFLMSPLNMFVENLYSHNRHGNLIPFDYSYNILQSCKKDAILFTNGDNDTFPLWYLQEVRGIRTDIRIVNLSLLNTDWYILQLKNETPHGSLKVPISLSDESIEQITPVQWRPTSVRVPVPPEVYQRYGVTDSAITNSGAIQFVMNPTIGGGDMSGVRTQDILVRNILETNKWERPIYFSVTVANSNFIGLDSYLEMQGMALEVVPFRQQSEDGQYRINSVIMKECLFNSPGQVYAGPHYGFRFTNLDNPAVYYDDNARRLTMNYRSPFMRMAIYYLQRKDTAGTIATLDHMESRAPIEIIPMDYRVLSDVARIYFIAGARDKYLKYSKIVEEDALAAIEHNPMDVRSAYNPYRILLDIYDVNAEYRKEIDLLTKLQGLFPNERSIQFRIRELQAILSAKKTPEVDSLGK